MTWLLLALGLFWVVVAVHDLRAVARLPGLPPLPPDARPLTVTCVLAVRDDGAEVDGSVRRLLAQQHVELRVVAVDDRSSDATGTVLAALAREDDRLMVRTVRELPPSWLGKSHALHVGAAAVASEWILFTDGDAWLAPDCLARAIAAAERSGADHVCLLPSHRNTTLLGRSCLLACHLLVQGRLRAVNGARQRSFVGTGAFNLVRTQAYRACGGHWPLRLEVVDDVHLGCLLFAAGFRSRVWFAPRDLTVDWGGTPRALLRVLTKNMFALLRFRTVPAAVLLLGSTALLLATLSGPWLARVPGTFALAAYGASILPASVLARRFGWPVAAALLLPCCRLWLPVCLGYSMLVTLRQRGVRWRGTFYPLSLLRRGRFRPAPAAPVRDRAGS